MNWRLVYGAFCLLYTAWLVYLGQGNFAKVYGEYRRAGESRQPARIERIALRELIAECRQQAERGGPEKAAAEQAMIEEACRSFPRDVLAQRQSEVAAQLQARKMLFLRKLATFAFSFAIFFVALPLGVLYLLLSFLIWVFKDMKFVK